MLRYSLAASPAMGFVSDGDFFEANNGEFNHSLGCSGVLSSIEVVVLVIQSIRTSLMLTTPNRKGTSSGQFKWVVLAVTVIAAAAWDCVSLRAGDPPPTVYYTVEDLGKLPGSYATVAWGINSSGDVVGWAATANGTRAFVYTDALGMVELPGLTLQDKSLARDINDSGLVVGQSNGVAVRWINGGQIESLGNLGGDSDALAINSAGEAVGWTSTNTGFVHGFLYTPGAGMVDITPSVDSGYAWDINNAGQVAGYANSQAFRWENGKFLWLGTLPNHAYSFGFGINSLGDITGSSNTASGNTERIFRFTDAGGMTNLGGAGETNYGRRINTLEQVVGKAGISGLETGVIYTDGVGLKDLNALITSPGEWFILDATDINDEGVIAAIASSNFLQETHAVRLRPTDDPTCDGHCLHSSIALSARGRRTVSVTAEISVTDSDDNAIPGATVLGHWTLPTGSTISAIGDTGRNGVVRFMTSGRPGTYTLTIDQVELTGYSYDRANSEVSESITR